LIFPVCPCADEKSANWENEKKGAFFFFLIGSFCAQEKKVGCEKSANPWN
jgi:hypothetical protein